MSLLVARLNPAIGGSERIAWQMPTSQMSAM
jgi:hypothetical protein